MVGDEADRYHDDATQCGCGVRCLADGVGHVGGEPGGARTPRAALVDELNRWTIGQELLEGLAHACELFLVFAGRRHGGWDRVGGRENARRSRIDGRVGREEVAHDGRLGGDEEGVRSKRLDGVSVKRRATVCEVLAVLATARIGAIRRGRDY